MRIFIVTLTLGLLLSPVIGQADSTNEEVDRDETLLRQSFQIPLQTERLSRGLTPRNAAIASQHALDTLIECWKSERNAPTSSEKETMVVRLGGKAIVTYATLCMYEFVDRIGDLRR